MLFHKTPAIIVWISMMGFSPAKSRILALRANNNIILPRHCHTFLRSPLWNNDRNQPLKIPSCRRQYSSAFFGTASSPSSSSFSSATMTLELPTPDDTEEVAAVFASILLEPYYDKAPPDQYTEDRSNVKGTILLDGDLGAGKTAFARGFLRAATGEDGLRVTSPTYLLVNVYPIIGGSLEIHHMDLYRLSGNPEDLLPLNLKHVFENCVSLIEWPERLGSTPVPDDRLEITITIVSAEVDSETSDGVDAEDDGDGEDDAIRIMTVQAHGPVWEQRLKTILDEGYLDDLTI